MPGHLSAFEAYVINLDRHPDRLANFWHWNRDCRLPIQRFPGADGETVDAATRAEINPAGRLTNGAVGCALSHRRLWQRASEAFKPIMVFEDDAVLRADIATAVPRLFASELGLWDIVLFGYNTDAGMYVRGEDEQRQVLPLLPQPNATQLADFRASKIEVTPLRLTNAFGTCGYIISPLGAKRLLRECFPIDRTAVFIERESRSVKVSGIDAMMNSFYRSINAYVCWPPLVLSPNERATSTTREPS